MNLFIMLIFSWLKALSSSCAATAACLANLRCSTAVATWGSYIQYREQMLYQWSYIQYSSLHRPFTWLDRPLSSFSLLTTSAWVWTASTAWRSSPGRSITSEGVSSLEISGRPDLPSTMPSVHWSKRMARPRVRPEWLLRNGERDPRWTGWE